jgi:hypothetical protein
MTKDLKIMFKQSLRLSLCIALTSLSTGPLVFAKADHQRYKPQPLRREGGFSIPKLPSASVYSEPKFQFSELPLLKIPDLQLPIVKQIIDLFVVSDGTYLKEKGWFRFAVDTLLEKIEKETETGGTHRGILLGCDNESPRLLVDPLSSGDTKSVVVQARRELDLSSNRRKTQNCLELLQKVADKIEKEDYNVGSLIFIVGTEWTFLNFNTSEPRKTLERILKLGAKKIGLIQLHEEGDTGIAEEFNRDVIRAAEKVHGVVVSNLPGKKISRSKDKVDQAREIGKKLKLSLAQAIEKMSRSQPKK